MIKLGKHSYCYGIQRGAANDVIVGNYSSIAENVIFDGGFNHNTTYISTFPFSKIWSELKSNILVKGDIIIGSDVWIGEGAVIMSGIKIGDGAIIGAHAVVTKDVPNYAVVGGVPAKHLKNRFDGNQMWKLMKIQWWNWDDEKVKANVNILMSDDINELINLHFKE